MPPTFDPFEVQILRALQIDGRLTVAELAEKIGLSTSPTWRRLKALEDTGVISRTVALLDPARAGVPQCVFVNVTLAKQDMAAIRAFESAVGARPEVLECWSTTGEADYLLRIMVPDTPTFERFLQEVIFVQTAVQHVRSNFTLRAVKFDTALPI
jgi:Lrp/AsnC family transcriptional regulator